MDQKIFKDFSKWTEEIPAVNYGLYTYQLESVMAEGMQAIIGGADIDETLKSAQAQGESTVSTSKIINYKIESYKDYLLII